MANFQTRPKRDAATAFGDPAHSGNLSKRKRRSGSGHDQKRRNSDTEKQNYRHERLSPAGASAHGADHLKNSVVYNGRDPGQDLPTIGERELRGNGRGRHDSTLSRVEKSVSAPNSHLAICKMSAQDVNPRPPSLPEQQERRQKGRKQSFAESSRDWSLSTAGGAFLDQDPVLAGGDQYLILPTKANIQVYSTATSLLVRTLPVGFVDPVTCCCKSDLDSHHIFVSTRGGLISKWDWTSGRRLRQWKVKQGILHLRALPCDENSGNEDIVLTVCDTAEGQKKLLQYHLSRSSDNTYRETSMLVTRDIISSVAIHEGSDVLVLCAGDRIILGSEATSSAAGSALREYIWREVHASGKIVSFDSRTRTLATGSSRRRIALDIALGMENGSILVYIDLLSKLVDQEKHKVGSDINARRLHWHREPVSSIKWSRDGNYLVSGGRETVLVMWQLDTNQRQYLPHLSAPICNVTISESGSSYVLKMGNNSVMALSTSDLLPTTHIAGPLLLSDTESMTLALVNPAQPDHLLLGSPTDLSRCRVRGQASFTTLQTFDIRNNLEVSRQALTRNITTVVNVNLKGRSVADPTITQMRISPDGKWLATIEEWRPPQEDEEPLRRPGDDSATRDMSLETTLRFWTWDDASGSWQVVTRVDEAHIPPFQSILNVASNPVKAEYATVGLDGYLRVWRPMLRLRNGMAVRNNANELLYTWICHSTLQLESVSSWHASLSSPVAALTYSDDGSVIIASWSVSSDAARLVHFIDSRAGTLRASQPNLIPHGQVQMAVCGSRLLVLSDELSVWDMVACRLVFSLVIKPKLLKSNGGFLAVNLEDDTFAVALNPPFIQKPAIVAVLDAKNPDRILHQENVHGHVKALLPLTQARGFFVLDGEARIRKLRPITAQPKTSQATVSTGLALGLEDVFGLASGAHRKHEGPGYEHNVTESGSDTRNMTRRSLEEVLVQQSATGPVPVAHLFEQVAKLFSKNNQPI